MISNYGPTESRLAIGLPNLPFSAACRRRPGRRRHARVHAHWRRRVRAGQGSLDAEHPRLCRTVRPASLPAKVTRPTIHRRSFSAPRRILPGSSRGQDSSLPTDDDASPPRMTTLARKRHFSPVCERLHAIGEPANLRRLLEDDHSRPPWSVQIKRLRVERDGLRFAVQPDFPLVRNRRLCNVDHGGLGRGVHQQEQTPALVLEGAPIGK